MNLKALSALIVGLTVVSAWTVSAEGKGGGEKGADKPKHEKAAKGEKAPAPELQDVKAEGTVAKVEKQGKAGKAMEIYELTDASGTKIVLPPVKAKKGEPAPAINLADFVGQSVVVSGKGLEKEGKGGKKQCIIKEIISIEKAAAAPAAPAAEPAKDAVNKAL